MEYVSTDPVEGPVVLFDVRKGSGLKAEKTERGVVVRDSFRRLLWLARGVTAPGGRGRPRSDSRRRRSAREREKFSRMHAAPLSHDFALQALNAPAAPLVWAEMEGGKEDLVYELDRVDHPSEALLLLHPSESHDPELRKFLWPVTLSHQPLDRDPRDPPAPRFLLTAVDLDLAASSGNDATLAVTETLEPVRGPIAALRLDLTDTMVRVVRREPGDARGEGARGDRRGGPVARVRPPPRRDRRPSSPSRPGPAGRSGCASRSRGTSSSAPAATTTGSSASRRGSPSRSSPSRPTRSTPSSACRSRSCRSPRAATVRRDTENGREPPRDAHRPADPGRRSSSPGSTRPRRRRATGSPSASRRTSSTNERSMKQLTAVAAEVIAFYRSFLGAVSLRRSSTSSRSTTSASGRRLRASCSSRGRPSIP